MKYCTNCFTKMRDEMAFCPKCGAAQSGAAGMQSVLKGSYLIGPVLEEAYEYTSYKGFALGAEKEILIYEDTRPLREGADEEAAAAKFSAGLSRALGEKGRTAYSPVDRFCEDGKTYIILEETAAAQPFEKPEVKKPEVKKSEVKKPETEVPEVKKPEPAKKNLSVRDPAFAAGQTGLNRPFTAITISAFCHFMVFSWLFAWLGGYREVIFSLLIPAGLMIASCILIRQKLLFANGVLLLASNTSLVSASFITRIYWNDIAMLIMMAAAVAVIAFLLWLQYVSNVKNGLADARTDGLNYPPMAAAVTAAPFAAAAVASILVMGFYNTRMRFVLILAIPLVCISVFFAFRKLYTFCATTIMAAEAVISVVLFVGRYEAGMAGFLILLIIGIAVTVFLNRWIDRLEKTKV